MNKHYTILMCKFTGKIGVVDIKSKEEGSVLVCISRDPIIYQPMLLRDALTLGWILSKNINSAFNGIPRSFYEHPQQLSSGQNSKAAAGEGPRKD
jgi:hypothetical protein